MKKATRVLSLTMAAAMAAGVLGGCSSSAQGGTASTADEPSMGLSPLLVKEIFAIIQEVNKQGITILLVEQNAKMALAISDRAYVLETGNISIEGNAADLLNDPRVKKAYLGQ